MNKLATHFIGPSLLHQHAAYIERLIDDYRGHKSHHSALPYLANYSNEFLDEICPQAVGLPAAFLVEESSNEEAFVGIHVSTPIVDVLSNYSSPAELLTDRRGLTAFLILAEELSHFHHYINMAESNRTISRFDLELQAELDKVVISALALTDFFGRTHLRELIVLIFNQCSFKGTLTDYQLASKIAEKFWKEHVRILGPDLIFDQKFRAHLHHASRLTGEDKRRILDRPIQAA